MSKDLKRMLKKKYNFGSLEVTGSTLAIFALVAVLLYGGNQGWFETITYRTSTTTESIIVQNDPSSSEQSSEEWEPNLRLTVDPSPGCMGDFFEGTVTSNMPGASCSTYVNDLLYKSYSLNSFGSYTDSQVIDTNGVAELFVTCRYQNINYDAPVVELLVESCYTCDDSDGSDFYTQGNCQDSFHQLGFSDSCENLAQVNEYVCNDLHICEIITITCAPGDQCIGGRCI